jgi:hypothetical protein
MRGIQDRDMEPSLAYVVPNVRLSIAVTPLRHTYETFRSSFDSFGARSFDGMSSDTR